MKKSEKFERPLLTPSTKAEKGKHDLPISEEEILSSGIVPRQLWQEVHEKALSLFALGQEYLNKQGLILVDTKYEFGLLDGKLILADEMHTLDSSRFWVKDSYQEKFEKGEDPANLDKEPTRQWLLSQGYQGNGEIPVFTDEHRVAISKHYISSYEKITGSIFNGIVADANSELLKIVSKIE
jgi:phosphoribosylaminoimidazole-succinocarboxamide synthase